MKPSWVQVTEADLDRMQQRISGKINRPQNVDSLKKDKKRPKKKQDEYHLQVAVCNYIQAQYGDILFLSDTIASIHLTVMQAVRNKKIQKAGFKCPDIIILEPRGQYSGLLIELKKASPYLQSGELGSNPHLQEQVKYLKILQGKGYSTHLSWTFEGTKAIIDEYLAQ